jgi:hypothetical protein
MQKWRFFFYFPWVKEKSELLLPFKNCMYTANRRQRDVTIAKFAASCTNLIKARLASQVFLFVAYLCYQMSRRTMTKYTFLQSFIPNICLGKLVMLIKLFWIL